MKAMNPAGASGAATSIYAINAANPAIGTKTACVTGTACAAGTVATRNIAAGGPLLSVKNLKTYFASVGTPLKAVDGISFDVFRGETLGIVGESGCGKTVACLSILRLLQEPPAIYAGGEILFDGRDILKMRAQMLAELRGSRISMIFQEPMAALNPVFTIENQMVETVRRHLPLSKREASALSLAQLKRVRIPSAEAVMRAYPFALSGGMRQRVLISMAMICKPDLLIADEPTTALDVTIQARILEIMKQQKQETGCAVIFITHDIGVIAETADRTMVMYAGKVCELAPTEELIRSPAHPYAQGLIASKPSGKPTAGNRLKVIPGNVPSLADKPAGCPFHPRCEYAETLCANQFPPMVEKTPGHSVACWRCHGEGE
ncbi:MAG: ABC transporter ATP-binding protein [Clostridiales bacterium]|jgi:peptide/nickel transport system ATP-binding protein/oligopeptide transport system ATP-binding protein|nr:ABC transporter ATP-binding protein [Clostridiales bacterium]